VLNIADCVNTWLAKQDKTLPAIYNDVFPVEAGDLIISRHDPSQSSARDFGDGTRMVEAHFSYYARAANAANARMWLEAILNLLDNAQLVRMSDGVTFQGEGGSLPQFVQVDDKGQTIYVMAVMITYMDGQNRP